MQKELEVLNQIYENKDITQRQLASKTGMSLGAVNLLLKRCIKKGLIKIERLNSRTIRYILTPQGFKEKVERTVQYISDSYELINKINKRIRALLKQIKNENDQILLIGEKNDIYRIIATVLDDLKTPYKHIDLEENVDRYENIVIIYWNSNDIDIISSMYGNVRSINIIEYL